MRKKIILLAVFAALPAYAAQPTPDIDWCSALTSVPGVTHARCNMQARQISVSGQRDDGTLFRIDLAGDNVSFNGGPWVSIALDPASPQAGLELAARLQAVQEKSALRGPEDRLVLCASGEVRVRYLASQTTEAVCAGK